MTEVIIIGILIVFIMVFLIFMLRTQSSIKETQSAIKEVKESTALTLMQQQIDHLRSDIAQQLQTTTGQVGTRLDKTAEVIANVSRELGMLSAVTKQVVEAQRDIVVLKDLLKPPKFRGELGEFFLENLLAQILPKSYYTCQYRFKNGIVDAVIHLRDRMVPVDSKFPLESFERLIKGEGSRKKFIAAVKEHISTIAQKYILPDEGTYEFALMYIPAENVYYETIIKTEETVEDGIFSYALEKRVIPVSPNSFYAYLQVIIEGLRGFHIERWAKEIRELISRVSGDFDRFKDTFRVVGAHLLNAKNKFDEAERKLLQLGDKLTAAIHLPEKEINDISERKELPSE